MYWSDICLQRGYSIGSSCRYNSCQPYTHLDFPRDLMPVCSICPVCALLSHRCVHVLGQPLSVFGKLHGLVLFRSVGRYARWQALHDGVVVGSNEVWDGIPRASDGRRGFGFGSEIYRWEGDAVHGGGEESYEEVILSCGSGKVIGSVGRGE